MKAGKYALADDPCVAVVFSGPGVGACFAGATMYGLSRAFYSENVKYGVFDTIIFV